MKTTLNIDNTVMARLRREAGATEPDDVRAGGSGATFVFQMRPAEKKAKAAFLLSV